jgi:hypothetical protein
MKNRIAEEIARLRKLRPRRWKGYSAEHDTWGTRGQSKQLSQHFRKYKKEHQPKEYKVERLPHITNK